jgi:hypothetical protein
MTKQRDDKSKTSSSNHKWKESIVDIVPSTSASVGGALVGLAIGGPAGAITGAAVTPVAATLFKIVNIALKRRRERAEQVLSEAAKLKKENISDFERTIMENDDRLAFAVRVLTAAADTPLPEKIVGFSRLLAAGMDSSREKLLDKYTLVVQALTAMNESHIRVLNVISSKIEDKDSVENGWLPSDLSKKTGESLEYLRPLVRLLEFYGLITDVAHRKASLKNTVRWQITELGLLCLKSLKPEYTT